MQTWVLHLKSLINSCICLLSSVLHAQIMQQGSLDDHILQPWATQMVLLLFKVRKCWHWELHNWWSTFSHDDSDRIPCSMVETVTVLSLLYNLQYVHTCVGAGDFHSQVQVCVILVLSDRRDRWVTARLRAEQIALQHCSSRLETDKKRYREKDDDTEMGMKEAKKDKKGWERMWDSHNKKQKNWGQRRIKYSRVFVSVSGTVQKPVSANNTCIHQSLVELQRLFIYTPVCLPAYLAVRILHSAVSVQF